MVYNRIRNQMGICVLVKSSVTHIHYKFLYMATGKEVDFIVEKSTALFRDVYYDTAFIPPDFDWGMKSWKEKLAAFYMENYGMTICV